MNFRARILISLITLTLSACSLDQPETPPAQMPEPKPADLPQAQQSVPFLNEHMQLQGRSFASMNTEASGDVAPSPAPGAVKSALFFELKTGDYDSNAQADEFNRATDLSQLGQRFWLAGAMARTSGARKFFIRLMENPELWNETDEDGRTLVHQLAVLGKLEILKLIQSIKLDNGFAQRDRLGRYPVHYASTPETAEFLWANTIVKSPSGRRTLSPALNLKDNDGRLPLHVMIALHRTKAAVYVINSLCSAGLSALLFGSGINAADALLRTPLHHAAMVDDVAVTDALVRCSYTDISAVDKLGRLPLHYASEFADFAVGYVLVNHMRPFPRQLNLPDGDRLTPLEIARRNNNEIGAAILSRQE